MKRMPTSRHQIRPTTTGFAHLDQDYDDDDAVEPQAVQSVSPAKRGRQSSLRTRSRAISSVPDNIVLSLVGQAMQMKRMQSPEVLAKAKKGRETKIWRNTCRVM